MNLPKTSGTVVMVSASGTHSFTKQNQKSIKLIKGLGIEGDAHMGEKVQHLSRIKQNPDQPNLRQVHLLHHELFDELSKNGYIVHPGDVGENITTRGIDILGLPTGTKLHIGKEAVVEITGLRNPCQQMNKFQPGLMQACIDHDDDGNPIKKGGIMSIVLEGGLVFPGDTIVIEYPPLPHKPLEKV